MPIALAQRIRSQPQWAVILEALVLAVLIGVADFLTGYDASLFVLYAIPIAYVVWYSSRPAGIAICIVCALAWCLADAKAGHPYSSAAILTWNTTVQLGFFVFTMISVSALKFRLEEDRARVKELERFQLLARISPVGIFRADANGRCIFVNQRWEEMTGLSETLSPYQAWTDALHRDDRTRVREGWAQIRPTHRDFEFEARFADAGGRVTWGYGRVAPEKEGADGEQNYVGAVMDITEHRRLEWEILQISEREQQRIGQDLHDDLCQFLTAIQYTAASALGDLRKKGLPETTEVEEINELLKQAVRRTRNLARGIFPVKLEQNGLVSALQELAGTATRVYGVSCSLDCPAPVFVEDSARATHLYRIAQEALANAIKHGGARQIILGVIGHGDWITLTINDNGKGFAEGALEAGDGMGFRIMRYRSHMIGGTLNVASKETGVLVSCSFRKSQAEGSQAPETLLSAQTA